MSGKEITGLIILIVGVVVGIFGAFVRAFFHENLGNSLFIIGVILAFLVAYPFEHKHSLN